jgi:hypothetical protein
MNPKTFYIQEPNTSVLKRTVTDKPKTGIECMFVRMTKTSGIKIFPTLRSAKTSFRRQKLAAKHGLAPKTFSKTIRGIDIGNLRRYDRDEDVFYMYKIGFYYVTEVASDVGKYVPTSQINRLDKGLRKIGLKGGDLHFHNVGKVQGKWVCIDFGAIST